MVSLRGIFCCVREEFNEFDLLWIVLVAFFEEEDEFLESSDSFLELLEVVWYVVFGAVLLGEDQRCLVPELQYVDACLEISMAFLKLDSDLFQLVIF